MTDEERIRATYRAYDESGRDRLWSRANRGYARISDDRDRSLLRLLGASLPADSARLLDAGCGDGALLKTIGERWPRVVTAGVDLLADRVDVARSNAPDADLRVASVDQLPFANDSFDVVTAVTLFSSIPTSRMETAAAGEIARVVRPGGWLVWYDLRYDNPSNPAVHGVALQQIRQLFPAWRIELRSITVVPPVARRLGRLTPVAYPILHALPPLRSHLIGRLQCPP